MGLAVLPARLKEELAAVAEGLASGKDLRASGLTAKHADWAEGFAPHYTITAENALEIVQKETGLVFAQVLEHAGVYKRTPEGKEAFLQISNAPPAKPMERFPFASHGFADTTPSSFPPCQPGFPPIKRAMGHAPALPSILTGAGFYIMIKSQYGRHFPGTIPDT